MMIPKNIEECMDVIIENYIRDKDRKSPGVTRLCVRYRIEGGVEIETHIGVNYVGCTGLPCAKCILKDKHTFDRWLDGEDSL